jgi:hypothetical protein
MRVTIPALAWVLPLAGTVLAAWVWAWNRDTDRPPVG